MPPKSLLTEELVQSEIKLDNDESNISIEKENISNFKIVNINENTEDKEPSKLLNAPPQLPNQLLCSR